MVTSPALLQVTRGVTSQLHWWRSWFVAQSSPQWWCPTRRIAFHSSTFTGETRTMWVVRLGSWSRPLGCLFIYLFIYIDFTTQGLYRTVSKEPRKALPPKRGQCQYGWRGVSFYSFTSIYRFNGRQEIDEPERNLEVEVQGQAGDHKSEYAVVMSAVGFSRELVGWLYGKVALFHILVLMESSINFRWSLLCLSCSLFAFFWV